MNSMACLKKKAFQTGTAVAKQWQVWSLAAKAGRVPKAKLVQCLTAVLSDLRTDKFTGDPARDWTLLKRILRGAGNQDLADVARNLDYLVAFNRGKRISAGLGAVWAREQQYAGAREILEEVYRQRG